MLFHQVRAIKCKEEEMFDSVLDAVGTFGTFQRRLVALTFVPNILSSFFMFADSFLFMAQEAYCNTTWILAAGPNLSVAEQMNLTLPRQPSGAFMTCFMYLPVDLDLQSIIQFGLNHTDFCHNGWIYPKSKKRLVTDEFDLVCGMEMDPEFMLTVYTAGVLIGSIIFGFICDKLGRYRAILLSLLGLIIFGFGTAFVNTLEGYLFFRFCLSQSATGYVISSMALVTEWLSSEHRARIIILSHCYFAVGILFLTGLAYSLPHWRLLFLVGGAPLFSVIPYVWILPESPRWLMVRGKMEEAKRVLLYAASVNKRVIPLSLLSKLSPKKASSASFLDFYSHRQLRRVIIVIGCMWFTISSCYLTLLFIVKDFTMSPYVKQIIPTLLKVPGRLCCMLLLESIGRKWALAVTLLQGSFLCLLLLLLPPAITNSELTSQRDFRGWKSHRRREAIFRPQNSWWIRTTGEPPLFEFNFLAIPVILLGELCLIGSITLLLVYTVELLPTVLRATGMGLMSLAFVVGAITSLLVLLFGNQSSALPISFSCVSAFLALFLCLLLPEKQEQPEASSSLEDRSSRLRGEMNQDVVLFKDRTEVSGEEDSSSDDVSEEAARNAILNSMIQGMDSDPFLMPLYYRRRNMSQVRID